MRADGTVDREEATVLAILAGGPAPTSGHTEDGRYRLVDRATCRRLRRGGLVSIDAGGWAALTPAGQDALRVQGPYR